MTDKVPGEKWVKIVTAWLGDASKIRNCWYCKNNRVKNFVRVCNCDDSLYNRDPDTKKMDGAERSPLCDKFELHDFYTDDANIFMPLLQILLKDEVDK